MSWQWFHVAPFLLRGWWREGLQAAVAVEEDGYGPVVCMLAHCDAEVAAGLGRGLMKRTGSPEMADWRWREVSVLSGRARWVFRWVRRREMRV